MQWYSPLCLLVRVKCYALDSMMLAEPSCPAARQVEVDGVRCSTHSPDRSLLASGCNGGEVFLHDAETGQPLELATADGKPKGLVFEHSDYVRSTAFTAVRAKPLHQHPTSAAVACGSSE